MQSLAAFSKHAGPSPVSEVAAAATQDAGDVEAEARAVLRWLALPGNRRCLMIVDNVDRDYNGDDEDPLAYDIQSFLPPADHGYILITSRVPSLSETLRVSFFGVPQPAVSQSSKCCSCQHTSSAIELSQPSVIIRANSWR